MNLQANNFVIIGGLLIIGIGWFTAASNNKPVSRVMLGGVGFIFLASVLDLAGGQATRFANAIVALALVTTILVEGPALFTGIQNATPKGKK